MGDLWCVNENCVNEHFYEWDLNLNYISQWSNTCANVLFVFKLFKSNYFIAFLLKIITVGVRF